MTHIAAAGGKRAPSRERSKVSERQNKEVPPLIEGHWVTGVIKCLRVHAPAVLVIPRSHTGIGVGRGVWYTYEKRREPCIAMFGDERPNVWSVKIVHSRVSSRCVP